MSQPLPRPIARSPRHVRNGAQHPRPDLGTSPDDQATDFAACWARLVCQWHLASDPLSAIEITVEDLRVAALELFSAGGVHHVAVTRQLIDKLAEAPDKAWENVADSRRHHTDQGRRTTPVRPIDCSEMT